MIGAEAESDIAPYGKCYGFGIADDRSGTAPVFLVHDTEENAEAARKLVDMALAEAIQVQVVGLSV
jgi:hypothetical protein